jgi:hypothetical protein
MPNESPDPELDWVRALWEAPPPAHGFHDRVLGAFVREAARIPAWRRRLLPLPIAAAVAIAVFLLALYLNRPKPEQRYYRVVRQPHFTVISQGEHP